MTQTHRILFKSTFSLVLLGAVAAVAQTVPSAPSTTTHQDFATEIAKADLAQDGITDPDREQLGLATRDVQAMRDSGMGWGAIANSLGLRLGEVVSAANRARHADDVRMDPADKSQKSAKHTDRTSVAAAVAVSADAPGLSVGSGRGANIGGHGKGGGKSGGNGGGNGGGGGKR